jgi:hypothetical protein
MPDTNPKNGKFLNGREWRSFVSAVQGVAIHTRVRGAVRAGQSWLSGGALQSSSWLMASDRFSPQRP